MVRSSTSRTPETDEEELSQYFSDWVASARSGSGFLLGHPCRGVRALLQVARLPVLDADLGSGADADEIRDIFTRRSTFGPVPLLREVKSILILPDAPDRYAEGSSKQTLRRKSRAALKLGVRWEPIHDIDERRRLLALGDAYERGPVANDSAVQYGLWLAGYAADGRPILLSVTLMAGPWSALRYFRTLGDGPEESAARYFMTQVLVEQLVRAGVRYLADTVSPAHLPNGLRHFQRMLGWRSARVRVMNPRHRRRRTGHRRIA